MHDVWRPSVKYRTRYWGVLICAISLVGMPAVSAQDARIRPATLLPTADTALDLTLQLPTTLRDAETTWDNVNIGECFIRSGGEQHTITPQALASDPRSGTITIDRVGPALLCLSVGPPESRGHSDSWQRVSYCAKIILDVQPGPNQREERFMPNPGVTAKTGQKLEILPLVDPTTIRPGHDLPIRVYFEGVKIKGAKMTASVTADGFAKTIDTIEAHHPTDSHGTTWFHVERAGTWTIRLEHDAPNHDNPHGAAEHYTAELIFQIGQGASS